MSQYPKDIERLFTASGYDGDWETTAEKLAEEVTRLRQRVTELEDERDIFKRTLDKRDNEVAELLANADRDAFMLSTAEQRVAELEERQLPDEVVDIKVLFDLQSKYKERGERMKEMRYSNNSFMDWFDPEGEPL